MRKRINRSPDLGDALALTFAIKVNTRRHNPRQGTAVQNWEGWGREPDDERSEAW